MGANPRENLRLPWERPTRIAKGRTESDLRALAARSIGFHVSCFRPGGILPTPPRRCSAGSQDRSPSVSPSSPTR